MKTLYSSSFISIVLAFLMFMGYNGQKVEISEKKETPSFTNVTEKPISQNSDKIKIDFFDDFRSSESNDFFKNTLPKIKQLELETGSIELHTYFIPDINDEMNYSASISLKCASDQGKFWEMLTKIHENSDTLTQKSFLKFGKDLEMNTDALQKCIKSDSYKSAVESDVKYASEMGINFKPTLIISGTYMIGDQPFENIQKVISKYLTK